MKITRIGADRNQDIDTDTLQIVIGSRTYRLSESLNRELRINKIESDDDCDLTFKVIPVCANEIKVK